MKRNSTTMHILKHSEIFFAIPIVIALHTKESAWNRFRKSAEKKNVEYETNITYEN